MSIAHAIITQPPRPSLLSRILLAVERLEESLELARELRRLSPEGARRLLKAKGLLA
jgi:hypothetical protein